MILHLVVFGGKSTSQGEEGSKTRVCVEYPEDLHLFRISFWPDSFFHFWLLSGPERGEMPSALVTFLQVIVLKAL